MTMRTPGHDEELALGFLHGEGLIDGSAPAGLTEDLAANVVEVAGPLSRDPADRRFYLTSSCGVCGKGALEEVAWSTRRRCRRAAGRARSARRPARARSRQPAFERTGGLHATGLFNAAGELICVREDVGRHNAMDKVDRLGAARRAVAALRLDPLRQRSARLRAGAEGGGRRLPGPGRRRRPDLAGDRTRSRPRHDPMRFCPRGRRECLHVSRSEWRPEASST